MKMCNEKYVDNWQNIEQHGGTIVFLVKINNSWSQNANKIRNSVVLR